jgi:hypothetical protein
MEAKELQLMTGVFADDLLLTTMLVNIGSLSVCKI